MIKSGRVDIITEVSLSLHIALPREGHLDATVHAIAYVSQKYNSRLVYDPSYSEIDHSIFRCNWSEFYWEAEEVIPVNVPLEVRRLIPVCL